MAKSSSANPGHVGIGADERAVLSLLAPLRKSLERIVQERHVMLTGGPPDPKLLQAEVELLWTVVLAAFQRGVSVMHRGMHRAEGVDHKLADEALNYALSTVVQDAKPKR